MTVAKWLLAAAAMFVVVGLLIFFWPERPEPPSAPAGPSATATQSGTGNVQASIQIVNGTLNVAGKETRQDRLEDGRVVVDVSPEYLVSLYEDHTQIQADRLLEAFIGKWMWVSGAVGDVSRSGTLSIGTNPMVFMDFDAQVIDDQLRVLRKGEKVKVLGRIERVSALSVELKDCELFKP